jgi:hypothetical protein
MPPRDRGRRRPHAPPGQDTNEQLPWAIVYYQAPDGTVPALEFFDDCPGTIDAQFHGGAGCRRRGTSSAVLRRRQMGGHAWHDGRLVRNPPDRAWA